MVELGHKLMILYIINNNCLLPRDILKVAIKKKQVTMKKQIYL
jgi:hypothetical protein